MSVNTIKTAALLALLSAVLIVRGGVLAGNNGMYFGLALALAMNFSSYFFFALSGTCFSLSKELR
jgi:hypothetical protein